MTIKTITKVITISGSIIGGQQVTTLVIGGSAVVADDEYTCLINVSV